MKKIYLILFTLLGVFTINAWSADGKSHEAVQENEASRVEHHELILSTLSGSFGMSQNIANERDTNFAFGAEYGYLFPNTRVQFLTN